MKISVREIKSITPRLPLDGGLLMDCSMDDRGYESLMEDVCEQLGDDEFLQIVMRIVKHSVFSKAFTESIEKLHNLLKETYDHLNYCGWGDSWERECSEQLRKELDEYFKEEVAA